MLIKTSDEYETADYATIEYVVVTLGADVNVKSFSDNSPLHYACASNKKEVVKLLLDHGAEVGEKNVHKKTEKDLTSDPEVS